MALKRATKKSRIVTKVEQARAPQQLSDSEDEKFNDSFSFADNAADYNFDTWKRLTQLVKSKQRRTNLSETIKKVVSSSLEDVHRFDFHILYRRYLHNCHHNGSLQR